MNNPLDLVFLRLTESGTDSEISLQASLIGAIVENTRGSTDVWTKLSEDGDSKVFQVTESREEIQEAMREGYIANKEPEKKNEDNRSRRNKGLRY